MLPFDLLLQAIEFAAALSLGDLVLFYWFTLFFEVPRYALGFPAVVALYLRDRRDMAGRKPEPPANIGKVSILVAGHNEADGLEHGIRSLWRQSFTDFEIVCVSDGSTDKTYEIMKRLQREGLVQKIAGNEIRGGKASAINLAARLASGDIMIVIDCDCVFEPQAIAEILRPFADPHVAGVSASVLVKNWDASLTASLQAIEYLNGMTLGKAQLDMMGQLCMISGAFGAFRRDAWMRVNGMDPGPGEDLDISLRLRQAGYKLAFAHRAIAYTDVPIALFNLLRQRARWERDSVWLRYRKYPWTLNPWKSGFQGRETIHQLEFLLFTVIPAAIFPLYLAAMFIGYGERAVTILLASTLCLLVLDLFVFAAAVIATGQRKHWALVLFVPIYGTFQSYVLRSARLYVFIEEWIYSTSRGDSFAPPKVNDWIRWK